MLAALAFDAFTLVTLLVGVLSLRTLGWLDRWHHLWLGLLAFCWPTASTTEVIVRSVFAVIAADDAWLQHLIQALAWARMRKTGGIKYAYPPNEAVGWHGIWRSPLHRLYAAVLSIRL